MVEVESYCFYNKLWKTIQEVRRQETLMKTNWECHSATINQWAGVLPLYTWEPFSEPTFKINSVPVCVRVFVCLQSMGEECEAHSSCLGETGRPPFHLVYLCLPILWRLHAPACTWVHARFSRALKSLCGRWSVRKLRSAVQQRALLFERMPEWVCHTKRKLEEKGDCGERDFPQAPTVCQTD